MPACSARLPRPATFPSGALLLSCAPKLLLGPSTWLPPPAWRETGSLHSHAAVPGLPRAWSAGPGSRSRGEGTSQGQPDVSSSGGLGSRAFIFHVSSGPINSETPSGDACPGLSPASLCLGGGHCVGWRSLQSQEPGRGGGGGRGLGVSGAQCRAPGPSVGHPPA